MSGVLGRVRFITMLHSNDSIIVYIIRERGTEKVMYELNDRFQMQQLCKLIEWCKENNIEVIGGDYVKCTQTKESR